MSANLRILCALALAHSLALVTGCGDDGYNDDNHAGLVEPFPERDAAVDADSGAPSSPASLACTPVVTSDLLPARTAAMSERGASSAGGQAMTTDALFEQFKNRCGRCHTGNAHSGELNISTTEAFVAKFNGDALALLKSEDPAKYMPPKGEPDAMPFSQRGAGDPVAEFAKLAESWLAAGRPADAFFPPQEGGESSGGFALPRRVGLALTNLGNCIPSPALVGSDTQTMQALDKKFEDILASASPQLPRFLDETDIVSLDSEVLARTGVVAFAPAYTLFADHAKKLRYVRVPQGKSIEFKADQQNFVIPAGTRFYKTFFKKIKKDHRGEPDRYRKIETRLIVASDDVDNTSDCTTKNTAVFGTYLWDENETRAELRTAKLGNGTGFRDLLMTYVTDEQAAADVIAEGPANIQEALASPEHDLLRHYGVPGSERCTHCHMGAPGKNFVLGFTPLQINRRPLDESGVIEPAERDELNQFQRLVDYGLITGTTSADPVAHLEDSQGDRKPRNDDELRAQGYMLGNCSHCHNPRGYPSRIASELREDLIFLPSTEPGHGIFQFPLDKTSRRILRGPKLDQRIPYLSPSLFDVPGTLRDEQNTVYEVTAAPWRSLIYRNVDSPQSYSDDGAIFPHMPMDTPGYDCRARRLLGSWMLSIPSRYSHSDVGLAIMSGGIADTYYLSEGDAVPLFPPTDSAITVPDTYGDPFIPGTWAVGTAEYAHNADKLNGDPSAFVEVKSEDPLFFVEQLHAKQRLTDFEDSSRYHDCQDDDADMVDPGIRDGDHLVATWVKDFPFWDPMASDAGTPETYTTVSMPARSTWSETDLTEISSETWTPRRSDWIGPVVKGEQLKERQGLDSERWQYSAIELLPKIHTEDVRSFALAPQPLGFWAPKDTCDLSSQPKDTDGKYAGAERPEWMGEPDPNAPRAVYELSPGAFVFSQVCSSCHGPKADSKGRQAATIADLTGGRTRVANLRDGLFGPQTDPGKNLLSVFADPEKAADLKGATPDTWAGRYAVWMGLGGTTAIIPPAVLGLVFNNEVLGERRGGSFRTEAGDEGERPTDANMLTVPRRLCFSLVNPPSSTDYAGDNAFKFVGDPQSDAAFGTRIIRGQGQELITDNGDYDLWRKLCTLNNPMPLVRVTIGLDKKGDSAVTRLEFYKRELYPADARVGDSRSGLDENQQPRRGWSVGIQPGNDEPWCIRRPATNDMPRVQAYLDAHDVSDAPICPVLPEQTMLDDAPVDPQNPEGSLLGRNSLDVWSIRGAMNAGLSVFVYLQDLLSNKGTSKPVVSYDHCELLTGTSTEGPMCNL